MSRWLLLTALVAPGIALAGDPSPIDRPELPQDVTYQAITNVDMDGVTVNGTMVGPEISRSIELKEMEFGSMVRLRSDFNDEMKASVDEVK